MSNTTTITRSEAEAIVADYEQKAANFRVFADALAASVGQAAADDIWEARVEASICMARAHHARRFYGLG